MKTKQTKKRNLFSFIFRVEGSKLGIKMRLLDPTLQTGDKFTIEMPSAVEHTVVMGKEINVWIRENKIDLVLGVNPTGKELFLLECRECIIAHQLRDTLIGMLVKVLDDYPSLFGCKDLEYSYKREKFMYDEVYISASEVM